MLHEIQVLTNSGWSCSHIAKALNVDVMTIYRWRDKGTNTSNRERLQSLVRLPPPKRGVYYLQATGIPWVLIGETQNLSLEFILKEPHYPTPLRLLAWYPQEDTFRHHVKWEAGKGKGHWFQYHPDMEQEGDTTVL